MAVKEKVKVPAKAKAKAKAVARRGVGVIDTIVRQMARVKGASVRELHEAVVKKFPERSPESMRATCRINATAWPKKRGIEIVKTRDEKRGGLIYKIPATALEHLNP